MDSPRKAINQALALHSKGNFDDAISLYRQILQSHPENSTVTANLASALVRTGRLEEGLNFYRELIRQDSQQPELWFNYANALSRAGQPSDAQQAFKQALEIQPTFFPAALNLANLLRDNAKPGEAIELYHKAIALNPQHPRPRINLARLLRNQKQYENAQTLLNQSLQVVPDSVELLYEQSILGYEDGNSDIAYDAAKRLLNLEPKYGNAFTLIGLIEYERGNVDSAVRWWNELTRLEPKNPEPHINLGTLRQKEKQHEQAVGHFRTAVRCAPDDLGANLKLGLILSTTGHVTEAMQIGQRLLKQYPDRPEGYSLLANGLHEQGRCEEARAAFDKALATNADDTTLIGNALFSSLYSDTLSDQNVLDIHRNLSQRLHQIATPRRQPAPTSARARKADARIRIGYLSPDLLMHPVGYFIEPILNHHNRADFEVICYSDNGSTDQLTNRLKSLDLKWHECSTSSDLRLEEQIRSDELDILIDLSGHTAKNRAMVLARKPAPVLATYLGYPGKTERPANDWLIADNHLCPVNQQIDTHEKIARLPECFLCYQPQLDAPDVAQPPFEKNGYVTFGSFNHLAKLTDTTIRLWSRILDAVPDSRLVLKALPLADKATRQLTRQRFADRGIDPQRVDPLPPTVPLSAFLAQYSRIDIGLDTVPYNGGTTTCDALWMGVPVVTLPGGRFSSRMGYSVLKTTELEEYIARDEDDYIRIATETAGNTAELRDLRTSLRDRLSQSPLCDAAAFTRGMETVYKMMLD